MRTSGQPVLIIGAGPCGLAAARTLQQSDVPAVVLNKEHHAGGLAASFRDSAGFLWDQGGHVVFSHYGEFDALLKEMMGEELEHHERVSYILKGDCRVPYPFQRNLAALDPDEALECIVGLVERPEPSPPRHFGDWMEAQFGTGITRHFMRPYNTKVWSTPPEQLSTEWMSERVAPVDWRECLANLVHGRTDPGWGPNSTFAYPASGGTGEPFRRLAAKLPDVRLGAQVVSIDPDRRQAVTADGAEYGYEQLISTMPLNHLVAMLTRCPSHIRSAAATLRHNQVQVVGVGADGPGDADWSWMYFPEPEYPFYRVTNLGHYADGNLPPGPGAHHSLMCEISLPPDAEADGQDLAGRAVAGLRRARLLQDSAQVRSVYTRRIPMAYPVPTRGRSEAVASVLAHLEDLGIYSRGRFGTWLYEFGNMDHAVKMGMDVACHLTTGATESIPLPHRRAGR